MHDERRTLGDEAHDVWRTLVLAFSPFRWQTQHDMYLKLRWLAIFGGIAAIMDATAFAPMATGYLLQTGIALWVVGMAIAWNPTGELWWRDPDARSLDHEPRQADGDGGRSAAPEQAGPALDAATPDPNARRGVTGLARKARSRRPASGGVFSGGLDLVLPEFDVPPEQPLRLLAEWIASAEDRGVVEPLALTLATSGDDGAPSSRVVLIKDVDSSGLVFSSHHGSRKGRELAAQPRAAGTLYWRETRQQINLVGVVARLDDEASNVLFADRIEFWHGSPDRLHRRLEYTLAADGTWNWRRLQP